jgi:hypothetical protein
LPLKRPNWDQGSVLVLEHDSKLLRDNPLGDPSRRKLGVWLPPGYDEQRGRNRGKRYPVLVGMAGFTSSGMAQLGWRNFGENVQERAARLVHERKMAPAIIVLPDCFTALGGNQYVNSSAIGPYADYLIREIVPFVDRELRTLASRDHRGCFGKSSGGYGAMVHGMKYPETWGAIADHSGDAGFDLVYYVDWPETLNELAKHSPKQRPSGKLDVRKLERRADRGLDDGRVERFLKSFWSKTKPTSAEILCLMNVCMAASYDPDPRAPNGFRLPFNLETGELIPKRWEAWRRHDPINLVARYRKNLKTLRGIYIDCGSRDQYNIHYGCRTLSKRLQLAGIEHSYEEFDDNHSDVDYRLDRSLPFLTRALR